MFQQTMTGSQVREVQRWEMLSQHFESLHTTRRSQMRIHNQHHQHYKHRHQHKSLKPTANQPSDNDGRYADLHDDAQTQQRNQ